MINQEKGQKLLSPSQLQSKFNEKMRAAAAEEPDAEQDCKKWLTPEEAFTLWNYNNPESAYINMDDFLRDDGLYLSMCT